MTRSDITNIWKWNPISGGWVLVRDTYRENAKRWVEVFQGDEPNAAFKVSRRRPVKAPKTKEAAQ